MNIEAWAYLVIALLPTGRENWQREPHSTLYHHPAG